MSSRHSSNNGMSRTPRRGDPSSTGDLSAARRRQRQGSKAKSGRGAAGRPAKAGKAPSSSGRKAGFMKYAADNKVVQAIYSLTTGPYRLAFYLAVAAAVILSVYFPVRDLYIAHRTTEIYKRQLEIREEYNEGLQSDVDSLLSTDGIENAARDLGLVMPGEQTIDVVEPEPEPEQEGDGQDGSAAEADGAAEEGSAQDEGDPGAEGADGEAGAAEGDDAVSDGSAEKDDGAPLTSAEVEAAEQAVVDEAPWYIKLLDALFFFDGTRGQRIASTGE